MAAAPAFRGSRSRWLLPGIRVTVAESQAKKVAFLREVIRTLGLAAEVWPRRVEEMPAERRFDAVTMRAVEKMAATVEDAAEHVREGGWVAALVGSGIEMTGGGRVPDSRARSIGGCCLLAKCSTWNIGILTACGINDHGHRGHGAAAPIAAGTGCALPWVFCNSSLLLRLAKYLRPWHGGVLYWAPSCRLFRSSHSGLWTSRGSGPGLVVAFVLVHDAARDKESSLQTASSQVSDAEAGAVSGEDSATTPGSGDLKARKAQVGLSVPRGTSSWRSASLRPRDAGPREAKRSH